jgi:hypothetical protein
VLVDVENLFNDATEGLSGTARDSWFGPGSSIDLAASKLEDSVASNDDPRTRA